MDAPGQMKKRCFSVNQIESKAEVNAALYEAFTQHYGCSLLWNLKRRLEWSYLPGPAWENRASQNKHCGTVCMTELSYVAPLKLPLSSSWLSHFPRSSSASWDKQSLSRPRPLGRGPRFNSLAAPSLLWMHCVIPASAQLELPPHGGVRRT